MTSVNTNDQTLGRTPYAFLSYSHADQGLVRQLAAFLAQEELPPWLDNHLEFGESWEQTIAQRIHGCAVFMVAMSSSARASDFVRREVELALHARKLVIPILLSGSLFEELKELQYVNLLDAALPANRFVERLRDLLTPAAVPSAGLQRRRVEHFVLRVFEEIYNETATSNVHLGVGFGRSFGVALDQPLADMDELDWAEVFIIIREHLPEVDLGHSLDIDYGKRFPNIAKFVEFMTQNLTWPDMRRLDSTPRSRGSGSSTGGTARVIAVAKNPQRPAT